jgi:hypothetical protein
MTKISKLISGWTKGTIRTSSAFKNEGVSNELVRRYLQSNWIQKVGNEAYKLFGDEIDFFGATQALQEQMGKSVRIGGKSALSILGYAHYLPQNKVISHLYGKYKENLPAWFFQYEWKDNYKYHTTNMFDVDLNGFMTEINHNGLPVKISSPELAMFEMLYLIPSDQSFQEAFLIIENLRTLRAEKVQTLLEKCKSVKVKRLVLFMLEENEQDYFGSIDVTKVNLGSGKRMIVKSGKYNSKYQITIPADLHD